MKPLHWMAYAAALLTAVLALPWLFTLAGDAQVHLAVAEQFSKGRPFQFNLSGEPVVASTSPFWTLLLTTGFWLLGSWTPLLDKFVVVVCWLATGYLLYLAARRVWHLSGYELLGVVGLWFTQTTVTANALGGLENILSAVQVLCIYCLCCLWHGQLTRRHSLLLGLLLGWAILTRLDGGFFAAGILALYLVQEKRSPNGVRRSPLQWLGRLGLLAAAALVVFMPWYLYQYQATGKWLTDSSLARFFTGRRGSIPLLENLVYLHPKSAVSLATAFFPLVVGCVFLAIVLVREWQQDKATRAERYPQAAALGTGALALLFYTFLVGGDSFGRYFMPVFPFIFLAGIAGLGLAGRALGRRIHRMSIPRYALLATTATFLLGASGMDLYRRVLVGRFDSGPILNVIYGPASEKYLSFDLGDIIAAPQLRRARSAELELALGVSPSTPVRFAVTEVQLRYFVDDNVGILSLDGRTSADILPYFDTATGIPDFERYFNATHPDFVHVAQWCYVGDWRAGLIKSAIAPNLICDWQRRVGGMQPGDSFDWQGHQVIYAAPDIVRIVWSDARASF